MCTKSELLFERFCGIADISFRRIPTESVGGQRTPDYELRLGNFEVLAEIKQIDPNSEGGKAGATIPFQNELGARLRRKISPANTQLKRKVEPGQPAFLVIYNNVDVLYGFTDPHNVMAAMYGQFEFSISRPANPRQKAVLLDRRLGGKRKLTHDHNRTLSAVCVLFLGPTDPYLVVYHNHFANNPLEPEWLRRPQIYQYTLGSKTEAEFPEWVQL